VISDHVGSSSLLEIAAGRTVESMALLARVPFGFPSVEAMALLARVPFDLPSVEAMTLLERVSFDFPSVAGKASVDCSRSQGLFADGDRGSCRYLLLWCWRGIL
jgi:hypothetical protein